MPFRINTPDVTHELVDGEVIVVNVVTGAYYSLNGSAATIWGWLDSGAEVEAIGRRIAELNGSSHDSVSADLIRFTADLQSEGLISPQSTAAPAASLDESTTDGIVPFTSPKFDKYSDMEELLLVDPIHEVSPHGWPETPPGKT